MTTFLQAIGLSFVAVTLTVALSSRDRDITLLLSIGTCCCILLCVMQYLSPVMELLCSLQSLSNVDPQILRTLLKAAGVGLISEIACLICADSGNAALGKGIQILSASVILWLSVPLIAELVEILQEMVGQA